MSGQTAVKISNVKTSDKINVMLQVFSTFEDGYLIIITKRNDPLHSKPICELHKTFHKNYHLTRSYFGKQIFNLNSFQRTSKT